jgi:hypothetical protein
LKNLVTQDIAPSEKQSDAPSEKQDEKPDDSDDDEDPDNEGMRELGIFEGDPTKEKDEYRQRVLDHFYG